MTEGYIADFAYGDLDGDGLAEVVVGVVPRGFDLETLNPFGRPGVVSWPTSYPNGLAGRRGSGPAAPECGLETELDTAFRPVLRLPSAYLTFLDVSPAIGRGRFHPGRGVVLGTSGAFTARVSPNKALIVVK